MSSPLAGAVSPVDANTLLQDPEIDHKIRKVARQLAAQPGFQGHEVEDLAQELRLEVVMRMKGFDPTRSPAGAFVHMVITQKAANLARDLHAACRFGGPVWSLDRTDPATGAEPISATIAADDPRHPRDVSRRSGQEYLEMQLDVKAVLSRLLPEERHIAEALQKEKLTAIARQSGQAYSTLHDKVGRVRARFEQEHLREYL